LQKIVSGLCVSNALSQISEGRSLPNKTRLYAKLHTAFWTLSTCGKPYSVLRLLNQPTRPTPMLLSKMAPGAGTGMAMMLPDDKVGS